MSTPPTTQQANARPDPAEIDPTAHARLQAAIALACIHQDIASRRVPPKVAAARIEEIKKGRG